MLISKVNIVNFELIRQDLYQLTRVQNLFNRDINKAGGCGAGSGNGGTIACVAEFEGLCSG